MATPKLSPVQLEVHHLGKKPLPEGHFQILRSEILWLWKEGRKNRYEFGKKCKQLQDERAHARNGTYMRDLAQIGISYYTAQRAIKFYVRAKKVCEAKLLQNAKDKEWLKEMGIEDLDELDRLTEAQQADAKLANLVNVRNQEIAKVMQAKSNPKEQPAGHRVVLSLSENQKEKFKTAWQSLDETKRTSIVYKAVLNAAKEN